MNIDIDTNIGVIMSSIKDMEEAHYHWIMSEIIDLISVYGYDNVMSDINNRYLSTLIDTDDTKVQQIVTEG